MVVVPIQNQSMPRLVALDRGEIATRKEVERWVIMLDNIRQNEDCRSANAWAPI
jgi:hypothetical protein